MHSDKKKLISIVIIITIILLIGVMYIYMLEPEQPDPTGEEEQIRETVSINQQYVTTLNTNKINTIGFNAYKPNNIKRDINMKKVDIRIGLNNLDYYEIRDEDINKTIVSGDNYILEDNSDKIEINININNYIENESDINKINNIDIVIITENGAMSYHETNICTELQPNSKNYIC